MITKFLKQAKKPITYFKDKIKYRKWLSELQKKRISDIKPLLSNHSPGFRPILLMLPFIKRNVKSFIGFGSASSS